jgi:hypothetical protein
MKKTSGLQASYRQAKRWGQIITVNKVGIYAFEDANSRQAVRDPLVKKTRTSGVLSVSPSKKTPPPTLTKKSRA